MFSSLLKITLCCLVLASSMVAARAEGIPVSPIAGYLQNSDLWAEYKSKFVEPDGGVVDNANNNISHSEGQGYAMLLAVAASDQKAFDSIYAFAKRELQIRTDSLFAWKYHKAGSTVKPDNNNATDGDILIAWALLEAAEAGWGDQYRKEALEILKDIQNLLVDNPNLGLLIVPGSAGFIDQDHVVTINPSYWIFPALERIYALTDDARWKRLIGSGNYLVSQLMSDSEKGLPDWAIVKPLATNANYSADKSSLFGYEAIRVPLYIMMAQETSNDLAFQLLDEVREVSGKSILRIDSKDGTLKGKFATQGYMAIAGLANCLKSKTDFPSIARTKLDSLYYPATLQLFSILVANREAPACL